MECVRKDGLGSDGGARGPTVRRFFLVFISCRRALGQRGEISNRIFNLERPYSWRLLVPSTRSLTRLALQPTGSAPPLRHPYTSPGTVCRGVSVTVRGSHRISVERCPRPSSRRLLLPGSDRVLYISEQWRQYACLITLRWTRCTAPGTSCPQQQFP